MASNGPDPSVGGLVAERLLQVIDEGRRTATYKLALLLALIDACAERSGPDGSAPEVLHTREIAHHVVRIYYPQVRPYIAHHGTSLTTTERAPDGYLRQINSGNPVTLRAVYAFHLSVGGMPLGRARARFPAEYDRCLDLVEQNFAKFPLLRFQNVGQQPMPFLYDVNWTDNVSLRALHASAGGVVRFRPGAAGELLRLAPLIRPLVELHWVRKVADLNNLAREGDDLQEFLFGATRQAFPANMRGDLVDLQSGNCFYCGDSLGLRVEVDHFLPWSRWPNDAVENLVATDRGCNGDKRDHLVGSGHVEHWITRNASAADVLAVTADDSGWESDPRRTLSLARAGYAHVPAGTPLWVGRKDLRIEDLGAIRARLANSSV